MTNQTNKQSRRAQLVNHLVFLELEHLAARATGDWDRVDFLVYCIDDTETELNKIKATN